jgi:serpin B
MIADIVQPGCFDDTTRLVLADAAYFKGRWKKAFAKALTRDLPFHLESGASISVRTMHLRARLLYFETASLQGLELPYSSDRFSMVLFLSRNSLSAPALADSLAALKLAHSHPASPKDEVDVSLPQFNVGSRLDLTGPLQAMGMTDAFGLSADLSGISSEKPLYVRSVLHKARVAVDEEGTEAAAATVAAITASEAPSVKPHGPQLRFHADHPFIFLIQHNGTDAILFLGSVCDPSIKAPEHGG